MKLLITTDISARAIHRDMAILKGVDLVKSIARRIKTRVPPSVTLEDLVSAGTLGLIQAVDRFDPSRDLQFDTYAKHRISGAMHDFLRGEDPLSRGERRRVRESAAHLSASGYDAMPITVGLDQIPERSLASPDRPVSVLRVDMSRARHCLTRREDTVITLLYDRDWSNREVATELGVNESRVSQIKQRAVAKLRQQIGRTEMERAA